MELNFKNNGLLPAVVQDAATGRVLMVGYRNDEAVRRTMTSTGRANLIACVALTTGFFVFLVSSMQNLAAFGLLIGFAFMCALLCELLVTPALLVSAAVGGKRAQVARSEPKASEDHRVVTP